MAIIFSAQTLMPSLNPVVWVASSSNINKDGFLFLFDIYSGTTGTERISRVKIPANPNTYGVYDSHKVLSNITTHYIPKNLTGFTSTNINNIASYSLAQGEEFNFIFTSTTIYDTGGLATFSASTRHYFSSGDSVTITQASGATNPQYDGIHTIQSIFSISAFTIDVAYGSADLTRGATTEYSDFRKTQFENLYSSTTLYCFNGAVPHNDFQNYNYTAFTISTGHTGRFLTNVPNYYKMDLNSRAYFNLFQENANNARYLVIETDNGGFYRITNSASTEVKSIVAVGAKDLNRTNLAQGVQPVIGTNTTRYSAYTQSSLSARTSEVKVFDMYTNCSNKYTQYQIIFLDDLGSWIQFNFDLASKRVIDIDRKEYKGLIGTFNGSTWGYETHDRGRKILNVVSTEAVTVTSNYLTQETGDYLEELFDTPEAYHIDENGNWLPIIIKDSRFVPKYKNMEKLINVELNFEYANRNERQRG